MKFHFDAYALCEIDVDDEYPEDASAKLLGIFQSRRDMAPMLKRIACADRKRDEEYAKRWMLRSWEIRPTTRRYVAVPISEISGDDLAHIGAAIEAAALLLYKGYGKAVAA